MNESRERRAATVSSTARRLAGTLPSPRLLLALATMFLVLVALSRAGFRFQSGSSGPRGIWQLEESAIERGSWVAICPTPDIAATSRERGYLGPGSCPGNVAPMLKRVVALPGDRVRLEADGIKVNGERLPNTAVRAADKAGQPLPHPPWGMHWVAPGTIWVVNVHADSFDSRYFGPVEMSRVLSVAEALLVEKEAAP